MQERTVLVLVVVLVVSTASAGVAVNLLRPSDSGAWRAFNLSLDSEGAARVGSPMNLTAGVRQGMLDPKTLPIFFLSIDVGTMNIASSSPPTNPWGYPTVWNLTGLDFSGTLDFNATVVPTDTGTQIVYAMIWVPLGDLSSVPIDASGHVNPSGVTLESVQTLPLSVTARPRLGPRGGLSTRTPTGRRPRSGSSGRGTRAGRVPRSPPPLPRRPSRTR